MPKLGALALVKAHPLVFGAVLAVAIGMVVYQLVKPKKHKKLKHSSRGPDNGDGGDDSPRQCDMLFYDPETKSLTTDAPLSNSSDNNLRRRRIAADSSSTTDKNNSEAKPEKKEAVSRKVIPPKKEAVSQEVPSQAKEAVSKEVQTEFVDANENIGNSKIMPDKNIDSAMSIDEKVKEILLKNICDSDSTDSNDESDSTDNIGKPATKCNCNCECHSTENDDKSNSTNNKILPDKNIDSAMSVDEKVKQYFLKNISDPDSADSSDESDSADSIAKPAHCNCECHSDQKDGESDSKNSITKTVEKCCCNYQSHSAENCTSFDSASVSSSWSAISSTDINDMNKPKTSKAPSICSDASMESESSSFTVLSGDSELCRGCEINRVNTHTEPCNHRYMCADCAPRIFRLFKKCKICRARIERIVVEE